MEQERKLPIVVTEEMHGNPYIMSGLAQKAFVLANYDMSPDHPVAHAIEKGLIVIEKPTRLTKIKRMPGNGSFA